MVRERVTFLFVGEGYLLMFYFIQFFLLWGVFIAKQLFDSCLLDMRSAEYSQLGATRLVDHLSSHIQCALVE